MRIRIAPHVQEALGSGRAVVALESTVITHGLPRPRNLELARTLEQCVRNEGAVPATIGMIAGELVVGLDDASLVRLAGNGAAKVSLWNMGALSASGSDGGTTVAATLFACSAAGVQAFATGGIGGVHHEPEDVSTDLDALARFPVVLVSSGPKSILDARATLERLETLGVPVVGYRSRNLAGFLTRETDLPLPATVDEPSALAAAFSAHRELGLPGGMLVSNPVSQGLDETELQGYLSAARVDAQTAGVRGKDITPFLLARLAEVSGGRTVDTNLRLLRENAALAARIAVALASLRLPRSEQ